MSITSVRFPLSRCICKSSICQFSAHIGGFVMGLFVGTVFYPMISETKRHRLIAWTFKVAAIPVAIILYVVLIRNFYTSDPYAGMSYSSVFCRRSSQVLCSLFRLSISIVLPNCWKQSLSRVCPFFYSICMFLTDNLFIELVCSSKAIDSRGYILTLIQA